MRKGANFDIEQNDVSSPKGNANKSVNANNNTEVVKPTASWEVTSKNTSICVL